MPSLFAFRKAFVSLTAIAFVALAACSSSTTDPKVCSTDEVKKCDDQLTTCMAASPCNDPMNAGFQGCVDACKKSDCDCQTACGNRCN